MIFYIEGKPVAKQSVRKGRKNFYADHQQKAYQDLVAKMAKLAMGDKDLIEEACAVNITVFRRMPKGLSKNQKRLLKEKRLFPITKPDVDNYAKGILDGMNGVVFTDDNVVTNLSIQKRYADRDYVVIEVLKLEDLLSQLKEGK
jgi:Holliday junction resolvase RusA-like endonuclease